MKLRTTKRVTIFVPLVFLGIVAYVTLFHFADAFQTLPGFLALLVGIALARSASQRSLSAPSAGSKRE